MKKSLSILLSLLIVMATVIALPLNASAVGVLTKGICLMDYSEFTFDAPEDTYPWNHYIVLQENDGEIEYDTFMEDVGTYDPTTNTLTLNNLKPEGDHRYELSIVGMENLTLRVIGECDIENIRINHTNLTITGPGKLYVNRNGDWDGVQVRLSSSNLTIGSDAYVEIHQKPDNGEEKEYVTAPIRFEYVNRDIILENIFKYYGYVSSELEWEKGIQDDNYITFTLKNDGDIVFSPKQYHDTDKVRVSLFYAPSDEELAAGCNYSIWMYNTYLDNKENKTEWLQTGSQIGSFGTILTSEGREVYGFRSSFDFQKTSKLWVNISSPNNQNSGLSRTITLENVDLEDLNEKVIFPDGSLHELDEKTFTPTAKSDISKCTVSGIKSKTYNAKAQTQTITVKDGSTTLKSGTDYSVSYKNNKNAGTATVTITGKGSYTGSVKKTFKIAKAAQPMKVTANAKSFKAKAAKKAKVSIKKAIIVKKNQGAVSYAKVSKGTSKGLSVSSKGVITVKKGTYKKGSTLKINVKVTAKGNSNYKSGSKTVTVKIKVK